MWADRMRRLTRYHCSAPDLPGHGDSAKIPWESLADAADRVAEVIRVRSESGTACLIGLSLGGSVGYVLLARHPELVSRVVVDGAAIVPNGLTPVLKAAVTLVSPLLHRRPVIRLMTKAFDIPRPPTPPTSRSGRQIMRTAERLGLPG